LTVNYVVKFKVITASNDHRTNKSSCNRGWLQKFPGREGNG